jgi:hypothetical protein
VNVVTPAPGLVIWQCLPERGRCKLHGGATPSHQVAAERVMAEQETARFGLSTVDVTAGEALIREVQRSAAMVEWLAVRVAALPEDDLTWGLVGRRITPPGTPNGQPTVHVEQRPDSPAGADAQPGTAAPRPPG